MWEVFCSIQSKMKFLVALLSATLVYGAAHPGHEDHGHIEYQQHDGPHCHDKKDQQCHKIPKEQEHEECYVDYEIVVDEYHADHYGHDGHHKRSADAGEYGYYSGPKCEDKKEQECHKHPHENSRKIPKTTCKKIVDTIYIEECEEIIHTVCEEAHQQYHHSEHVA